MHQIVIGGAFGDEGKGLLVDYLYSVNPRPVVRFNSHTGAGHTVVDPITGERRIHSHGSTTFWPNHQVILGSRFICNPFNLYKEEQNYHTNLLVHPDCIITTPFDILINQMREIQRESYRHGSTGNGFGETIERCIQHPETIITFRQNKKEQKKRFKIISERFIRDFNSDLLYDLNKLEEDFFNYLDLYQPQFDSNWLNYHKHPLKQPLIFEGAQGLLLSCYSPFFPHVTRCDTGCRDALELINRNQKVEIIYVLRSYWTRHGNGLLPGENVYSTLKFEDKTNTLNKFQGNLRFAPINLETQVRTIKLDIDNLLGRNFSISLVITHLDQTGNMILTDKGRLSINKFLTEFNQIPITKLYLSRGETRNDIEVKYLK